MRERPLPIRPGAVPGISRPQESGLPPDAERAFAAERAQPMRVRLLFIIGVQAAIWVSQFILFESQIFPSRKDSLIYRAALVAICVPFLLFLRKSRTLRLLEWSAVAACSAIALAAGYAVLTIFDSCVVPFTLTLEWGQMVVVLAAQLSLLPATAVLLGTWTIGAVVTTARAHWDLDLSDHIVLLGVYAVVLSAVRSFDALRRKEFVGRYRLEEANAALVRADEVRTRLFVNLSHDFRTPLALIHAEAELLERDTGGDGAIALSRVRSHAGFLANLTDELLELARLEAGRTPRTPTDFDVGAMAREVSAHFRGAGPEPIVQIVADGDAAGVQADSGHVRRILTNLIDNAVRQVRQGGGVRVRIPRDDGTVTLDVEDDGPGIPKERRAAIFERFASFDAAGSVASGIGLPVAHELAELNLGTLALVEGAACTTFRLRLPEAVGPLVAVPSVSRPAIVAPAPAVAAGPKTGRSILVVEDHADMARVLGALLAERFDVTLASTVSEAEKALRTLRPFAILCDVLLPDGNGYAVLEHVRGRRRFDGTPFLFVSALSDVRERARGLAAGADDYLTKPFSGEELLARVEAACARAAERAHALDTQRLDFIAELHDGVAAALSRAAILLSAAPDAGAGESLVQEARATVREGLVEVRTILSVMDDGARSSTFEATAEALQEDLESTGRAFSIDVGFAESTDGTVQVLSSVEHHTLRRIAREAVTNAIKHGKPTRLELALEGVAGELRLRVEDDGAGIVLSGSTGRGLGIARRRMQKIGGTIEIAARAKGGTIVDARIPLRPMPPVDPSVLLAVQ